MPEARQSLGAQMRAEIKMPPQLQEPYERIVLAGLKVMFSPQTHQMALQSMDDDGPLAQRLGEGIAALMNILYRQSNNTLPPQLILPVAVTLLTHAVDFFQKSGEADDQTLAQAAVVLMPAVIKAFGGSEQDIARMFGGFDRSKVDQQAGILGGQVHG